ncbi:unnamed protein product [Ceratitis capitata]|uniref:(Mediterranean fruit fly) hypothetical protein n=1 Tax=Ceratitis capitata TaxID=7213 RepID=A0A811U4P3_CERCA|nr:unnamed protein product [Ceratitis capitata]
MCHHHGTGIGGMPMGVPPPPQPPQQSMMSGSGVGAIGGLGSIGGDLRNPLHSSSSLLGSHISLGGLSVGGGGGGGGGGLYGCDTIISGGPSHCRSLSGLSSLSIGPPIPAPPVPPPPLFNPCGSTSFNSIHTMQQGPSGASRWGPRTSCPIHSPFRVRAPNGSICSGHQVI